MAKTAINIDRDLADRAASLLGTTTLTDTVDQALRDIVRRGDRRDALQWFRDHPFSSDERALNNRASW